MPMDENSTLGVCNEKLKEDLFSDQQPTKKTLDFLKMFARTCNSKESLQCEILEVSLN